jgi:polyribonucleotide 5'-hydroxyl-kinase
MLILGGDNAGKTSLAKILTSYARRRGTSPFVINLDPSEGLLSLPGTLSATEFKSLLDVEEGWGSAPMSGPNGSIPVKLPLIYFYGHRDPGHKGGKIYQAQVSNLALAVKGRYDQDSLATKSGLIIDTPGSLATSWTSTNAEIINHIVSEFSINNIVCIGSERLHADIVKRFDQKPTNGNFSQATTNDKIHVMHVNRSGGCVDRDEAYMSGFRAAQFRTYFYGNPRLSNGVPLQPRQQQVDFSTLNVWQRVGSFENGTHLSASAPAVDTDEFLPGDFAPEPSASDGVPLPADQMFDRLTAPQTAMRSCVLALLHAPPDASQEALRDAEVYGFVYVTDVDETRGKISLLSPAVGRVPPVPCAIVWAGWPEGVLGMV